MLYITRKRTERVLIMNEVEIQIVKIEDDRVQIGITAPPDVPVHRLEVQRKVEAARNEELETSPAQ